MTNFPRGKPGDPKLKLEFDDPWPMNRITYKIVHVRLRLDPPSAALKSTISKWNGHERIVELRK